MPYLSSTLLSDIVGNIIGSIFVSFLRLYVLPLFVGSVIYNTTWKYPFKTIILVNSVVWLLIIALFKLTSLTTVLGIWSYLLWGALCNFTLKKMYGTKARPKELIEKEKRFNADIASVIDELSIGALPGPAKSIKNSILLPEATLLTQRNPNLIHSEDSNKTIHSLLDGLLAKNLTYNTYREKDNTLNKQGQILYHMYKENLDWLIKNELLTQEEKCNKVSAIEASIAGQAHSSYAT